MKDLTFHLTEGQGRNSEDNAYAFLAVETNVVVSNLTVAHMEVGTIFLDVHPKQEKQIEEKLV